MTNILNIQLLIIISTSKIIIQLINFNQNKAEVQAKEYKILFHLALNLLKVPLINQMVRRKSSIKVQNNSQFQIRRGTRLSLLLKMVSETLLVLHQKITGEILYLVIMITNLKNLELNPLLNISVNLQNQIKVLESHKNLQPTKENKASEENRVLKISKFNLHLEVQLMYLAIETHLGKAKSQTKVTTIIPLIRDQLEVKAL